MKLRTEGKKKWLYTGSYNVPVLTGDGTVYHGKGRGIQVFLLDEEQGTLEALESYPDVENASWLAFSPDRKTLYAVNELDDYQGTKGGALSAFAVGENGRLTLRNRLPVMGAAPCHTDCSPSGEHVFTANYSGGSLSRFTVAGDGSLKEIDLQMIHRIEGTERPRGIDQVRQEKPHVHSVSVFGEYLWVTDLGLDEISVYKLDGTGKPAEPECRVQTAYESGTPGRPVVYGGGDEEKVQPKACCRVTLPAGSGPRSLAFREDGYIYVSCELSNEIGILRWEEERITVKGFVPCTPGEDTAGRERAGQRLAQRVNLPGGILLSGDGRYLYAGNRGHDSIAVFRTGKSGMPEGIQWISSGGRNPRGFQLSPSGRWLIAANQDSDNMVVFRRDEETGKLVQHARYEAGAVVCIAFL